MLRFDSTGGSGSTAIAAISGLPIVMTTFPCDAFRWLGNNYTTNKTDEDLCTNIEKLYLDQNYYEFEKKKTQDLALMAVDSIEKWEKLFALIEMDRNNQIIGM